MSSDEFHATMFVMGRSLGSETGGGNAVEGNYCLADTAVGVISGPFVSEPVQWTGDTSMAALVTL